MKLFFAFVFMTRSWVTLIVLIASRWLYTCWKFCSHCSSRVCRLITAVTWSCKRTCVNYILLYFNIPLEPMSNWKWLHRTWTGTENNAQNFSPSVRKKNEIFRIDTHTILQTVVAVCAFMRYVQVLRWILCSCIEHISAEMLLCRDIYHSFVKYLK
jgi:hypothetical protein